MLPIMHKHPWCAWLFFSLDKTAQSTTLPTGDAGVQSLVHDNTLKKSFALNFSPLATPKLRVPPLQDFSPSGARLARFRLGWGLLRAPSIPSH